MRHIIKTTVNSKKGERVSDHVDLDRCLLALKLYKKDANEGESFHIGYDDVTLGLEDWEEAWIEQCSMEEAEERKYAYLCVVSDKMDQDFWPMDDDTDYNDTEYEYEDLNYDYE